MRMAPELSLGVTALLDELLSETTQQDRCVVDPLNAHSAEDGSAENKQRVEPQQELEQLAYPDAETLSAEQMQQLAELHEDVDGCLASLEAWEEESRLRRMRLEKELEEQYRFDCLMDRDEADGSFDDNVDIACYLGDSGKRTQHEPSQPSVVECTNVSVPPCINAHDPDEPRRADADRIAKLRAEVDALRQQEAQQEALGLGPWDHMQFDDPNDSMVGASALSAWCEEVDDALGNACFDEHVGGLTHVRDGLNNMDSALEAAHSRVDADLEEMDKLLAECNSAIQTHREVLGKRPSNI